MGLMATAMIAAGLAILVGYGIYELLNAIAEHLAGPVRIALVLLVVGFILFIVALIRARLIAARECDTDQVREDKKIHTHPEKKENIK